jgi:hypothetical protein
MATNCMDWIAQHQSQFLSPSSFLPNYHFPPRLQARNRIPGPTTRYLRYPFIVSSKNGRSLYYPRPSSQNTLGTLSEFISDTKSVDTYPNIHMLWHIFGILALLRIGYMNCHCQKGQASNRVRSLSDLEDPRILFVRAFAGLD